MSPVPDWLLRRLRSLPRALITANAADGSVLVQIGRGQPIEVEVRADAGMSGRAARALAAEYTDDASRPRQRGLGRPWLLAVDTLRPAVRLDLLHAGLSWAERRTGYLHLDAPPYLVHLDGSDVRGGGRGAPDAGEPAPRSRRPTTLRGRSGCCVESLILWVEGLTAAPAAGPPVTVMTPKLLATLAGVTTPLASAVLHRLEQAGALHAVRSGKRTFAWEIVRPDLGLDVWAAEDRPPVRDTPLYVWARSPVEMLQHLTRLDAAAIPWAVGGVRAADLYAPTLTAPPSLTLWAPNDMPASAVAGALKGEVVREGATLTLRQTPRDPWARHRVRLHQGRLVPVVRTPAPAGPAPSVDAFDEDPDDVLARALRPWAAEPIEGLTLVSRPRAFVEALADGRGRSAEVAEALRTTLAVDVAPSAALLGPGSS